MHNAARARSSPVEHAEVKYAPLKSLTACRPLASHQRVRPRTSSSEAHITALARITTATAPTNCPYLGQLFRRDCRAAPAITSEELAHRVTFDRGPQWGYVRRHLPSATIVTLTDFEAYVVDRKLTHEAGLATSNGHLKISHLAESLLLGRGRVCVGSPRSTFSKIATTWW